MELLKQLASGTLVLLAFFSLIWIILTKKVQITALWIMTKSMISAMKHGSISWQGAMNRAMEE